MKQAKQAALQDGDDTKKAPLHRTIYMALLQSIRTGEYRDGDRLPSEAELCKQFNASRITVAKAIQNLQQEGMVVRRPGSGSYVQSAACTTTSYQFGLLIPELGTTEIFEPICQGIMRSPQAKSHSLIWGHMLRSDSGREETALALCRQFIEQKVSGVFFAPLEYTDSKDLINHRVVAELRQAGIPIVLLDRCYLLYPMRSNLDRVGIDNHRASYLVTQHLWDRGARRIVFLARKRSASTMVERVSGYFSALRDAGSQYEGRAVFGDVADADFVQRVLREEHTDAVVCGNDLTAARLMQTLIAVGTQVPEQVRLVSFDDVNYAKFLPVPLTTIHQNCDKIGEAAIELMLQRIAEPERPGMDVQVPFELVVRESCGQPAHESKLSALANG